MEKLDKSKIITYGVDDDGIVALREYKIPPDNSDLHFTINRMIDKINELETRIEELERIQRICEENMILKKQIKELKNH